MTPKSALLTAGTTTPPAKPSHPGHKPVTTQEKLDFWAAKKAKPQAKAMSPPPDADMTDKPVKKRKTSKYLPPPGEVFQTPKVKAKARSRRDNKPYTTNEKISAEELRKKVMGNVGKKLKAERKKAKKTDQSAADEKAQGAEKGKDGKKEKAKAKGYVPSTLALLSMSSSPTAVKFEDVKKKSVLMRPTARAMAEKQALAAKTEAPSVLKPGEKKKENVPFRIMDLPEEIRNRIWKLAVVHHPFCVWPGQRKGREQPDLAMSGKEVRGEVLPLFYGANVFGIDITPLPLPEPEPEVKKEDNGGDGAIHKDDCKDTVAPAQKGRANTISKPEIAHATPKPPMAVKLPDPIAEIKPWTVALDKGGHLTTIKHWMFSSTPEIMLPGSRIPKINEQKSLVVYLNIWREVVHAPENVPTEAETKETKKASTVWRANVEVHGEACCVLPGAPGYQRCIVKMSPEWLNGMVDIVLRSAEKKGVTAEMMVGFAQLLRTKTEDLVESRCESMG